MDFSPWPLYASVLFIGVVVISCFMICEAGIDSAYIIRYRDRVGGWGGGVLTRFRVAGIAQKRNHSPSSTVSLV